MIASISQQLVNELKELRDTLIIFHLELVGWWWHLPEYVRTIIEVLQTQGNIDQTYCSIKHYELHYCYPSLTQIKQTGLSLLSGKVVQRGSDG